MSGHLVIAPVLVPFLAGTVLMLAAGHRILLQRAISLASVLVTLGAAVALLSAAAAGDAHAYRLGDWPAPFGIVLVLDRLAAIMVLLTSAVALFSLLQAVQGEDRAAPLFHPLFQMQLVGVNGAFLTGDLFNLFVFFEILLIASYGLLVYGSTPARLRSGVHYVVLNLVGSSLFLIAVGTLYGATGTLNMADLARKVAVLGAADAVLVRAAGLLLLVVFALKAAVVPLYFWLPSAYAAASAPVAALFAIMTKVGVYSILRVCTLIFGAQAGAAADVALPWLLPLALVTIVLGTAGAAGSRELRGMQGYLLIGSVGLMLASIALFRPASIAAALYYLVHSTLVMAAMFLVSDLIARQRGGDDDLLVRGVATRQPALLGTLFFAGSIAVAGLPPLSGFIGKALILASAETGAELAWTWAIVLGSSLLAVLALSRAGIVLFWDTQADARSQAEPWRGRAFVPAAGLLVLVVGLTLFAGPVTSFMDATAQQLLDPQAYIRAVLEGAP